MKIHHVALAVSDLQKSVDWYSLNLGFKLISDYSGSNMNIALLEKDDSRLELFHLSDTEPLPEYHKNLMEDLAVVGTKHVCFEINDMDQMIKTLQSKNVEFVMKPDSTFYGGRYVIFKDRDGILIELFERNQTK